MKLKLMVDDINDVPEALREYYVADGDKFVLDAADAAPKGKLEEFRENNIALKRERESLERKLKKYDGFDPKKAEEAQRKLQEFEDQTMIDAGKMDEVLAQRTERMRADYDGQVTALQEALEKSTGQTSKYKEVLSDSLLSGEVATSMTDVAVVRQGAMGDIIRRARGDWVVDDNAKLVPMRNGEVIYGPNGDEPITMKDWSAGLFKEAPYLFEPNSGGGSGGGANAPGGQGGQINLSDQAGLNSNIEAIARGKVTVVPD